MISIRDRRINLRRNISDNSTTINTVAGVYVTAVGGLFAQLSSGVVSIKRGSIDDLSNLAKPLAIWVLLACISIGCLVFFIRFIARIKESPIQNWLNVVTVVVFAVALNIAMALEYWSLITLGLLTITWKTYQLRKNALIEGIGNSTNSYLRSVLRNYIVLSVLAVAIFGIFDWVDKSSINLAEIVATKDHPKYDVVKSSLTGNPTATIALASINQDFKNAKNTAALAVLAGALITISVFTYIFFTATIVRKITIEEVLDEYEKYYSKGRSERNGKHPPAGPEINPDSQLPGMKRTLLGLVLSARPITSLLAGFVAVAAYIHTANQIDLSTLSEIGLSVLFTSAFGFMFNDVVDETKDRNRIDPRPLALGMVRRDALMIGSACCSVLALVVASLVSREVFILVVFTNALLYIYSYTNKISGLWANAITGICTALLFHVGMIAGNYSISLVIVSGAAFIFTVAREIVLDLKDRKADTVAGKPSIARILSTESTLQVVVALSALATSVFLLGTWISNSMVFFLLSGVLVSVLTWVAIGQLIQRKEAGIERFVQVTRLAFLAMATGLVIPA